MKRGHLNRKGIVCRPFNCQKPISFYLYPRENCIICSCGRRHRGGVEAGSKYPAQAGKRGAVSSAHLHDQYDRVPADRDRFCLHRPQHQYSHVPVLHYYRPFRGIYHLQQLYDGNRLSLYQSRRNAGDPVYPAEQHMRHRCGMAGL